MKKTDTDIQFIQNNYTPVDIQEVIKITGMFTADYIRMVIRGVRKQPIILEILQANIIIRKKQEAERLALQIARFKKLMEYNFFNKAK